jgi:hypothetical protein
MDATSRRSECTELLGTQAIVCIHDERSFSTEPGVRFDCAELSMRHGKHHGMYVRALVHLVEHRPIEFVPVLYEWIETVNGRSLSLG